MDSNDRSDFEELLSTLNETLASLDIGFSRVGDRLDAIERRLDELWRALSVLAGAIRAQTESLIDRLNAREDRYSCLRK